MIDWNKPLRMVNAGHLVNPQVYKITDSGNKIIVYHVARVSEEFYTVVDRDTGKSLEPNGYGVENVPEEPCNHLCLYKFGNEWCVNIAGSTAPNQVQPRQLQPKSYWIKSSSPDRIIIKVPT